MRPPPQYPLAASLAGVTDRGVAILDFDPLTGSVKAAQMNPSTGDEVLDHAALKTFRKWQFRAGGASRVNVPIQFTMGRPPGMSRPSRNDLDYAVYAAPPLYPAEARCLWRLRHALSVGDCGPKGRLLRCVGRTGGKCAT